MKIPEYTRRKFASSAVGVPQADRSGEIIGESIAQAGYSLSETFKKREDKIAGVDAAFAYNRFVDRTASTITKLQLDPTIRQDPDQLTSKWSEENAKIRDEFAQGLSSTALSKYRAMADNHIAGVTQSNYNWTYSTKIANTKHKIKLNYANAIIQSRDAKTADEFVAKFTESIERANATSKDLLTDDEIASEAYDARFKAFSMHGATRVITDTKNFLQDLNMGKYNDYSTPEQREDLRKQAETRIIINERFDNHRKYETQMDIAKEASMAFQRGDLSIYDIEANINFAKANPDSVPEKAVELWESLKEASINGVSPTSDSQIWSDFVRSHNLKFKMAVDTNKKSGRGSADDMKRLYEAYGEAYNMLAQGLVTKSSFNNFLDMIDTQRPVTFKAGNTKDISAGKTGALVEQIKDKPWFGLVRDYKMDNPYSIALNHVEKKKAGMLRGKTPEEQSDILYGYMEEFSIIWQGLPPEIKDQWKNERLDSNKLQFIRDIMDGQKDEKGNITKSGVITRREVILHPLGAQRPKDEPEAVTVGEIITMPGGFKGKVIGTGSDGRAMTEAILSKEGN